MGISQTMVSHIRLGKHASYRPESVDELRAREEYRP
jgi:hypothetical protein